MELPVYAQTSQEVILDMKTSESGLSIAEVKKRLAHYGKNALPEKKTEGILSIFLHQFQSPLVYILLIASGIIFLMKEYVDGSIILFVLIFNAIVGTIQEGRAENTLQALKKYAETMAKVRRNGKEYIVPDYDIVPGDIILLQEGDKISADARILVTNSLRVDESTLTGESLPIHKSDDTILEHIDTIADQKNMVFKGTHVVGGNARAVVIKTGVHTELGKISQKISDIDTEIPLKKNIRSLTQLIIIIVLIICCGVFSLGFILGHSAREMFATVISLAVSIIPEGLPIVMTLVLATGVWRMSKRNALVKKLQAVEALGQAQVIAVDKTGTLTKNELSLREVYVNQNVFHITGEGYSLKGNVLLQGEIVEPSKHLDLILAGKIAAYVTENSIVFDTVSKEWKTSGDPTESALCVFSRKIGFAPDSLEKEAPKLSEIPFQYTNRFHAIVRKTSKQTLLVVIGAPEELLERSLSLWHNGTSMPLSAAHTQALHKQLTSMSQKGLRVIAFAMKENSEEQIHPNHITDLTFIGFYGLQDTLRPEVHHALKQAREAGIQVVMITGDHKITAEAIAREAGIFQTGDTILDGKQIDALNDQELTNQLDTVSVFARVTPEHKLRIVEAYKRKGRIVAMTGDGVNDAPPLVAADLGIGMGKIGTEVAKEASDIVLLDDNFASIVAAVEEGRSIYKTIKKVILYLFSTSFGEVSIIVAALFLGLPLPILPAQIVWLNFITDGFLDVSLTNEPKEAGLLKGAFHHPHKYLLDGVTVQRMILMALTMMVGSIILFRMYYETDPAKASTVALTVMAVFQWFNAWNCRNERLSLLQLNPFSNIFLVGATGIVILLQLAAVYVPFMQSFLHTIPLEGNDWVLIILTASSIIVVEEIRKLLVRKFTPISK
ncbi:HAD-IC family P-type ATPase [Candidatus Roizmanbacteria bacterium]|nr:HAD-IC family P-type ATPase [Candidatus Roizmanbacteria bacterium]